MIHLANSIKPMSNKHLSTYQLPKKYILFVGNRAGYKNFIFFITSLVEILKTEKDLYLICAGGGDFTQDESSLLNQLEIADKVIYQQIENDSFLAALYQKATFFVFPSLYEGFGIPVLEAFACSCPVILARSSCFPEIAGDAALFFDPDNTDSLTAAMRDMLKNKTLRENYIQKGLSREKCFSWQKTAEKTRAVYQKVCEKNR